MCPILLHERFTHRCRGSEIRTHTKRGALSQAVADLEYLDDYDSHVAVNDFITITNQRSRAPGLEIRSHTKRGVLSDNIADLENLCHCDSHAALS